MMLPDNWLEFPEVEPPPEVVPDVLEVSEGPQPESRQPINIAVGSNQN
jgi:hypothetical protein